MHTIHNQAQSVYRALAGISRSRYIVIATKSVHRLQICPIVHNQEHSLPFPKLHPGPCSTVGECSEGQTDRQTHRQADTQTWPLYISRRLRLARNLITSILTRLQCYYLVLYTAFLLRLMATVTRCRCILYHYFTRYDRSTVISPNLWPRCSLLLYFLSILLPRDAMLARY